MSNHSILTFQFGNYSNYVGAHLWNLQEAGFKYSTTADEQSLICNDVLYREGCNQNGQVTYTPRLLLVDLNGSLKHVSHDGELYHEPIKRNYGIGGDGNEILDSSNYLEKLQEKPEYQNTDIELLEQPAASKSEYQMDLENPNIDVNEKEYNFADSVESWVDYMYARYHPRTVNVVNAYKHMADCQTFDTYTAGTMLWQAEAFEEDFCDKIRQYIEECDFLQGFQTIMDGFNGFAGLAIKSIEHCYDQYGRSQLALPVYMPKNILIENADEAMTDSIRVVNSLLTFDRLIDLSSLFIPLSTTERIWRQLGISRKFPTIDYKMDNLYQTSSILATYIDTISIRYRLENCPSKNLLPGFCSDLNYNGRKLAAAALALPFQMNHNDDLIDCLDKFDGQLFTSLTPNCTIGTNSVIQSLSIRGIPENRLKKPLEKAQKQMQMAAYKCSNVSEMIQLYLHYNYHASMAHVSSISTSMPVHLPFPIEIFDKRINKNGFIESFGHVVNDIVTSVPVLASAQVSNDIGDMLETLHREAKRIKINKLHRFKLAGMENDDYETALENILQFKDNYDDSIHL